MCSRRVKWLVDLPDCRLEDQPLRSIGSDGENDYVVLPSAMVFHQAFRLLFGKAIKPQPQKQNT